MADEEPKAEASTPEQEEAKEPSRPEGEAEYFVDDDAGDDSEVVILMAILNQGGSVLQGRKIWRRLAVPADFNLLELHVVLQNAFDWEDTHLHDFTQPKGVDAVGGIQLPPLPPHGPSDLPEYTQHMPDVEQLPSDALRTFRAVVGVKEDHAEGLVVTQVENVEVEGGEPVKNCLVYVEHSHPHAKAEGKEEEKEAELSNGPTQVLEERAFLLGSVLSSELPVLVYEYDFRMGYEVHLFFEARSQPTEGVNYPTCLAGQGASPAEDGDDMDDSGNLLPSYDYDAFAVLDVLANFEKTFEDKWPLGPGAEDKRAASRCYLCRYNRECGRRRECSGKCCDYCQKHSIVREAGRLALSAAQELYDAAAERIKGARKAWAEGKCEWVEDDGKPCAVCAE